MEVFDLRTLVKRCDLGYLELGLIRLIRTSKDGLYLTFVGMPGGPVYQYSIAFALKRAGPWMVIPQNLTLRGVLKEPC